MKKNILRQGIMFGMVIQNMINFMNIKILEKKKSDCPMSSADCCELFFASENEQNRENLGRINNIFEEKKRNPKEIKELKKENEKLKNMMKIQKQKIINIKKMKEQFFLLNIIY